MDMTPCLGKLIRCFTFPVFCARIISLGYFLPHGSSLIPHFCHIHFFFGVHSDYCWERKLVLSYGTSILKKVLFINKTDNSLMASTCIWSPFKPQRDPRDILETPLPSSGSISNLNRLSMRLRFVFLLAHQPGEASMVEFQKKYIPFFVTLYLNLAKAFNNITMKF